MESDTKKCGTEQSVNLPSEIIEEILLRLEVKSLLRFRCVSKSWFSLIKSDRFIKSHFHYSTQITDFAHHKVLFNRTLLGPLWHCSLRSLMEKSIPNRTNYLSDFASYNSEIVGFCNGLVCFLKKESSFFLMNPSTRISKELPKIDNGVANPPHINHYGFGWDESSGAYKVFVDMLTPDGSGSIGKVYSSNTNSWKTVERKDLDVPSQAGQFVGGRLHWSCKISNIIWYFDLKTELFGKIEHPVYPKVWCDRLLGVLGGCLCVVCHYSEKGFDHVMMKLDWVEMPYSITEVDVWVMKEYGVKESWLKLDTVSHVQELILPPFTPPFAVGQNDEILITYASNFLVYLPEESVLRPIKVMDCFFRAHVYVESLVSPGN